MPTASKAPLLPETVPFSAIKKTAHRRSFHIQGRTLQPGRSLGAGARTKIRLSPGSSKITLIFVDPIHPPIFCHHRSVNRATDSQEARLAVNMAGSVL